MVATSALNALNVEEEEEIDQTHYGTPSILSGFSRKTDVGNAVNNDKKVLQPEASNIFSKSTY